MNWLRQFLRWLWNVIRQFFMPTGFRIKLTPLGEDQSTQGDDYMNIQIADDGQGVEFDLTPTNKVGTAEPLPSGTTVSVAAVNPAGALVVAPKSGDTTQLVWVGTLPTPPIDATGVVVTFAASGTVNFSQDAPPLDIVADNTPSGFSIKESAL